MVQLKKTYNSSRLDINQELPKQLYQYKLNLGKQYLNSQKVGLGLYNKQN